MSCSSQDLTPTRGSLRPRMKGFCTLAQPLRCSWEIPLPDTTTSWAGCLERNSSVDRAGGAGELCFWGSWSLGERGWTRAGGKPQQSAGQTDSTLLALYENMLVELPFAGFFLSKLLGTSADVDIHHLASLDPEVYKNLLFLKSYEGDVEELGLNFTVVNNDLGEAQVVELKFGGKDIPVTSANRIAYIHLVADYRLNRQIRQHCLAFRQGLANVVNLEWLRMFDQQEIQVLISGAQVPISLEDLKSFTNYSGGYSADHPVIKVFWRVVEGFTDEEKRKLLKFVTSCSRPPLLGFKELYPAFCIHNGGSDLERLPTASTCMNLLKLPEFYDETLLRSKLLYAIECAAGFELS
uniref:HECT-type E3 ubiquitin transferase n=1 Tax=Canis lupus familiaris TaxID=9615 RepID=A0A8C0RMA5_CANLF